MASRVECFDTKRVDFRLHCIAQGIVDHSMARQCGESLEILGDYGHMEMTAPEAAPAWPMCKWLSSTISIESTVRALRRRLSIMAIRSDIGVPVLSVIVFFVGINMFCDQKHLDDRKY